MPASIPGEAKPSQSRDPVDEFLAAGARVDLDRHDRARFVDAAARIRDWEAVIEWAERHGLTPLVYHHLRANDVAVPANAQRRLGALVVRHRAMVQGQTDALCEIVDVFGVEGIEHVVLKGAILAHMIYPSPELRPMGDLDILVNPDAAVRAQLVLRALGFDAPLDHARRVLRFHHHLPMATRRRGGALVCVEIHSDAVSPDQPCRLRLGRLSEQLREVDVRGRRVRAFGHTDMLVHLSWHVLEPRERTRLIGVADFVGYAAHYAGEIDWEALRRRHPRVFNALALMHYVTPLPEPLRALRPPDATSPPSGIARGSIPLASLSIRKRGVRRSVGNLLYPPEWWMRVYYGVPPGRSLSGVRWGRHLWRVFYWMGRRALALSMPRQRHGTPDRPIDPPTSRDDAARWRAPAIHDRAE